MITNIFLNFRDAGSEGPTEQYFHHCEAECGRTGYALPVGEVGEQRLGPD